MILWTDPREQYLFYKAEIDEAVARVLDSGSYILGSEVHLFEQEFSEYIGLQHGIGTSSGTDALHLALMACEIKPGDEIITPSHTAVATVAAIVLAGAVPVFVDIEDKYFTVDPNLIASAITNKTRAIVPVHLYGQPADMSSIVSVAQQYGLFVIEDCAQAHGATYEGKKVGTFGDLSCFSFYPTKNLSAMGDAGFILTANPDLADKVVLLREYGWKDRHISSTFGWNSRLDELQAAILRVKLKYLDPQNEKRSAIAAQYNVNFRGISLDVPEVRPNSSHAYHLYVIQTNLRDELIEFLHKNGVMASIHYPLPVHRQPAYKQYAGAQNLWVTDRIRRTILSLPIYPELSSDSVAKVINCIKHFFENHRSSDCSN